MLTQDAIHSIITFMNETSILKREYRDGQHAIKSTGGMDG